MTCGMRFVFNLWKANFLHQNSFRVGGLWSLWLIKWRFIDWRIWQVVAALGLWCIVFAWDIVTLTLTKASCVQLRAARRLFVKMRRKMVVCNRQISCKNRKRYIALVNNLRPLHLPYSSIPQSNPDIRYWTIGARQRKWWAKWRFCNHWENMTKTTFILG